ncbi:MAG: 3-hydroxyacyl-CoA dehydrogenase [marine bacterium B5-7]|nr:MAG: 3-hydroxyacyl-CoA dehydrogenase [marine bacterium B5-7]
MTQSKQHALVTGGGSGVGKAIAIALSNNGYNVTIVGRRIQPLINVAAISPAIHPLKCDVTDPESVKELFKTAEENGGPLDVVVANAGAADSKPFARTSIEDFNSMLAVNLTGVFLTLKHAVRAMGERGSGRLICIASTAGLKGYPFVAPYCAAKHGVIGLVRSLALELARTGITVNALCPGFTDTPLVDASIKNIVDKTGRTEKEALAALTANNPQGRLVQPKEIAEAVLWLCGPNSDAVNGQAIAIAGGEV